MHKVYGYRLIVNDGWASDTATHGVQPYGQNRPSRLNLTVGFGGLNFFV